MESGPGFESQKVHEFLTAALQFNPPLRVELSKPWSVPSWRDNGMAEVAKRDRVFRCIWTDRVRNDVMAV